MEKIEFNDIDYKDTLDSIDNHNQLKFAMTVAVAGRHHLLVWGDPNSGNTEVLNHLPELLPKLSEEEFNVSSQIWEKAGLGKPKARPFRFPHQTASIEGMCGGGVNCRPGEISLAHNGVLFLDYAAEFRCSVLQMLRVPLELGQISLSRAGETHVYPAKFQLFMSTLPCPCGNFGSHTKICLDLNKHIGLYWKKFSAPLLDRMTIRVNSFENEEDYAFHSLETLRNMIKDAWTRQYARQGKLNQDLTPNEILSFIKLDNDAQKTLDKKVFSFTPRETQNVLKVARTVADIDGDNSIVNDYHIKVALKLNAETPMGY